MEQGRKSRNKPTHLWLINYDIGGKTQSFLWQKAISSISGAGKTEKLHVKE